jgi:predicted O-linked N-acetylglucosamine transferase (SPINDLY family)
MDEPFRRALGHYQSGRLEQAEAACREILGRKPDHFEAVNLLALLLHRSGRSREAIALLQAAVAQGLQEAAAYNNLGEMLRQQGRLAEAVEAFAEAIAASPSLGEAHFNLGNAYKDQGDYARAMTAFRRAVALRPDYAKAHFNLANTLREEGRAQEALTHYRESLASNPNAAEVCQNYSVALYHLGQLEAAAGVLRKAIELKPDAPRLHGDLGNLYRAMGRTAEADAYYRRQQSVEGPSWLADLRREALVELIPPDNAYIDRYRRHLADVLDRLQGQSLPLDPAELHTCGAEPPMALAYQGREDLPLARRYGELFSQRIRPLETASGSGRPRVGIVVTDGHEGVFVRCLGHLVARLAGPDLEVSVICSRAGANVIRHLLPDVAWDFLVIPERVDQAAQRIAQARFDLLHYWEVGSDAVNYFLPYFRPAPLQSACWGWPVTSGNPRIDYFVSSRLLEPEDGQAHYSERLVKLATLPTYYLRPAAGNADRDLSSIRAGVAAGAADPAKQYVRLSSLIEQTGQAGKPDADPFLSCRDKSHVYLVTQNLRKYHPDFDPLVAEILRRDPAGKLLLAGDAQPSIDELLLGRLRRTAADVMDRIRLVPRMATADYFRLVGLADVILDTPHYGGGANTLYDAFACGTPVVTLPGAVHRSRYASAAYARMGITEPVASSAEAYVDRAVEIACHPDLREDLRRRILAASEVLFEDRQAIEEHRAFFESAIAAARQK